MELVVSLLVIGAILLILETILPGAIAGILGACCILAGIFLSYSRFGLQTGNFVLLGSVAGLLGGFAVWINVFPNSRLGRRFVSSGAVGNIRAEQPELLHQTGHAHTHLRPSGTAVIGGRRVDVVSEGGLIEKGTPVKVVAIEGMRVVVRSLPKNSS
jgi:membrane-bound serine protease (ClpP class)